MKAAPFEYVKPATVDEALLALDEHLGMARVLAGGQSLVPMLGMRLMRPSALVDINGLGEELGQIEARGAETVIGALVRYADIETSPVVSERLPLLRHVVRFIGDRQVRNRGTIGGALAQADPTGEMALACLVLDATIVACTLEGERDIPAAEFFAGSYASVLEAEELLVAVRFPPAPDHCRFFERGRKHNDFAVLSVAAAGSVGEDGAWTGVRLALGGVNDRPMLAAAAAAALEGRRWDDDVIDHAAALAMEVVDAPDDVRAGAAYREHLVPIHVRRVLRELAHRERR
ncbi:MAG TPA: xanthine dehydrogenase family protein subunit M [Baekduia sp.]|uniref:FAD binding domain-containing protein n=1 Tax=Baekduia sp. TaxID=2600305 RepID=UPI002C619713|nr:xanthine dehydrogenase family protein subunit M [Baekduia sp.]HMJ33510.1 xanthine dehydrogenase family protein subunit M [Baekduia sp.]